MSSVYAMMSSVCAMVIATRGGALSVPEWACAFLLISLCVIGICLLFDTILHWIVDACQQRKQSKKQTKG